MKKFKKMISVFFLSFNFFVFSENYFLGSFISASRFWKKIYNDPFPVKIMVKDLAELGVNNILFYDQVDRGAEFLHPTQVKNALAYKQFLNDRDFLNELLEEAGKYNINVWIGWTTPSKEAESRHKGKGGLYDIDYGLNSPELKEVYRNLIKEIGEKYTKYKNLAGIFWEEMNVSEAVDNHENDIEEFKRFCKDRFGEDYREDKLPIKVNPGDKWWRRYVLWKNNIVTDFVKEMSDCAKKYNLKTFFLFYVPESYSGASWKWGYDIIGLEKVCDYIWVGGHRGEGSKFYQSIKGIIIDFGPSYPNQILSKNYSYAFHGLPLNFYEHRFPIYIREVRDFYSSSKEFTEKYGDFYTGRFGFSEKDVQLFLGKENLKNWLNLMVSFQPGESPSKIAVVINPVPFILKNPSMSGVEYDKKVNSLMESLTGFFDIDGFIIGSLNMDNNLKKYSFIIMPEDMATGLKKDVYDRFLKYVENGGKLFVINTPITTGEEDLTNLEDKTEELCGIIIKGRKPSTDIIMESEKKGMKIISEKTLADISIVEVKNGEIIVKEKNAGFPLLTRYKIGKGEVYFSAISFSPELSLYFASIIENNANPIIKIQSQEIRIIESVKKGNKLAVALWGKGKGILKVDIENMGIKVRNLQVKDIITGKIIRDSIFSGSLLKDGVEVEIKYVNQPYILGIGSKKELEKYNGIYSDEIVFEGLVKKKAEESPEVPIIIPKGEGARVGVYYEGIGAGSIIKVLEKEGIRVFSLPKLDNEALSNVDVLVIPQIPKPDVLNQAMKQIREFVENGGGILFTHDAVGYRNHKVIFPEIGKGIGNVDLDKVKVIKEHPVTDGFKTGDEIVHKYYDHIGIEKGEKGEVIVVDDMGYGVVVVGEIGKGRVVLNGMISGYASVQKGSSTGREEEPEGGELKILVNSIKWLSGKKK